MVRRDRRRDRSRDPHLGMYCKHTGPESPTGSSPTGHDSPIGEDFQRLQGLGMRAIMFRESVLVAIVTPVPRPIASLLPASELTTKPVRREYCTVHR